MITLSVNDRGVQGALTALARRVQSMQPAFDEIGEAMESRITEGFKAQTSPYGEKWKPLSQTTILRRLGRNKSNFLTGRKTKGKLSKRGINEAMSGFQALRDTGRLLNSINHHATQTGVLVGSAGVIYAAFHQFGARQGAFGRTRRGAPIPWGNVPARPYLPIRNDRADLPPAWRDEVIEILRNRIAGGS